MLNSIFASNWTFLTIWPLILGALSVTLLLSGIDDLMPAAICLWGFLTKRNSRPGPGELGRVNSERSIAIFVPCWKESDVIENMIRHNVAAIRYNNYDFFLGCYPNDEATVDAAERLAQAFDNVHVAICPHPGPTSKADCLNWVYQRMLLFEEEQSFAFDTIMMHDAEDLIHAESLDLVNRERTRYDMIQVPVLPLETPLTDLTHGIYIDDFAEYQTLDMPARQWSGSFIPSNGVGTAFAREVVDRLAKERGNRIFEPSSLTEDYECGVAIHQLGFKQSFASLRKGRNSLIATREYFPRRFWPAVRQRTRWVMGIGLQSWERNGWKGSLLTRYWFWRDRKGLIANWVGFFTTFLFVWGLVDWVVSVATGRPWIFTVHNPAIVRLCAVSTVLQLFRMGIRMVCVARIFGPLFAAGVPIRSLWANTVNSLATSRAVIGYARGRILGLPLAWLKTEHSYPNREALRFHKRDLAEILVGAGYLDEAMLSVVLANKPAEMELADFLVSHGLIADGHLCEAISLQSGVPTGYVDPIRVSQKVMRTLPMHIERRFKVLAFRLQEGRLMVAGPRVPPSTFTDELREFTSLPVVFQLVTASNYEQLRALL